jgi:hypothetical protein
MRTVQREELLDYMTYTDRRPELRTAILATKARRRAMIGEYLTFLFENHDTVWYQIQEMMRVERLVRDTDIEHERTTYNELLGGPGELGVCLLIGIVDPDVRKVLLRQWADLLPTLYLELADGQKVRATWDERQIDPERLSSVQYLKFDVGGETPLALGSDHTDPALCQRSPLSDDIRAALAADLADE